MSKVLFHVTNIPTFSTSIGYIYEIARQHRVVLLTEKIDDSVVRILSDKSVFPGLEQITVFESAFGGNIFTKNYRLHTILKKTIKSFQPDIVFAPSDMWPAEMYLLRLAKRMGSATVALQSGFKIAEQKQLFRRSYLVNAYNRAPGFLPLSMRIMLVKLKKWAGYALYHCMFPFFVGERPFLGKTSFLFWNESSGKRDADYVAVFSKRDRSICVQDGISAEKIIVLGHPLEHKETRNFLGKMYFSDDNMVMNSKIVTIMWSAERTGLKRQDNSFISENQMDTNSQRMVHLIAEKLQGWRIFIKPYPFRFGAKTALEIQEFLMPVPQNISVVDPSEPAEKYIGMSNVIIGIPPASTTLFTASKKYPEKIILSINLNDELLGDSYKDFEGIEYIDTEEKLIEILDSIREETYTKQQAPLAQFDFDNAAELVNYIYAKRIS